MSTNVCFARCTACMWKFMAKGFGLTIQKHPDAVLFPFTCSEQQLGDWKALLHKGNTFLGKNAASIPSPLPQLQSRKKLVGKAVTPQPRQQHWFPLRPLAQRQQLYNKYKTASCVMEKAQHCLMEQVLSGPIVSKHSLPCLSARGYGLQPGGSKGKLPES